VQTFKEILRPGESKAFVTWQEPTPNCEVTLESSDSTAPDGLFTFGKHTRQYIYRHETGFSMTCDVNIEVEGMFLSDWTTQHNTTQHNTTQHNTTQHNTTQHNTKQHNTTQHNTTQHFIE
jgi:hypothetical protein